MKLFAPSDAAIIVTGLKSQASAAPFVDWEAFCNLHDSSGSSLLSLFNPLSLTTTK